MTLAELQEIERNCLIPSYARFPVEFVRGEGARLWDAETGECLRTFQPIGGLHHARRAGAAGFCVFNDCGVVIDTLRSQYGVQRVAYVDIDVHHGDGLYYPYEEDPDLIMSEHGALRGRLHLNYGVNTGAEVS